MSLTLGTRLGPYEIVSAIGAGGMGEVYRAKDTKLNRDVALKVLPEAFTSDPDRLARFRREAQVLASLNHPHIAAIYGFEDSGATHAPLDGARGAMSESRIALVMELVDGEDLSAYIARGPIALTDALLFARQIADALEAAHEQAIVHRDLKPQNVKVTPNGTVKVLDFGLAKAMDPAGASGTDAMNSPTLTGRATQMGMILGTAAYMAPEQAKGRPVDRRADIWAFGVVLFEMLSGKRVFEGDDVSEVMAGVLKLDPDWSALPADLPAPVRHLLKRCLEKDPKKRLRNVAEGMLQLEDALAMPVASAAATAGAASAPAFAPVPLWRRAMPIASAVIVTAAVIGATMWLTRPGQPAHVVSRFVIPFGEGQQRTLTYSQGLAISPDGTAIVYLASDQIYVRAIGGFDARPLTRAGVVAGIGPRQVVFSPDGASIGYVEVENSRTAIKKIDIAGGASVTVAADVDANPALDWQGDSIFFSTSTPGRGVMRVAASGGQPEQIIQLEPGETASRPQVLDDGRVLFAVGPANPTAAAIDWAAGRIVVQRPGEKTRTTIFEGGTDPRYLPSGHLIYQMNGVLYARTFDPSKLAVGGAVSVVEGVFRGVAGHNAWYAVSDSGTLVYLPGPVSAAGAVEMSLALFDRAGKPELIPVQAGPYSEPRMSPDGNRIAFGRSDARDTSIWVYDLVTGGSARRLTTGGHDRFPVWSGDSQRVIFQSDREGDLGLFWQRADGVGTAERLTPPAKGVSHVPQSASPGGNKVLLVDQTAGAKTSLMTFTFADKSMTPFGAVVSTRPTGATFSPSGRWVAYTVREAGASSDTVYIQPFPATGEKVQISTNAEDGHHPVWSSDGKELYYNPAPGTKIVAVTVMPSPGFAFGPAPPVAKAFLSSSGLVERTYDVARDGKRFLGLISAGAASSSAGGAPRPELRVVLNWFDELKTRAPIKK
jgi:serine/threonine-protein kinase